MSETNTPTGWKLVPEEPTLAMQNAAWREVDKQGFAVEDTEVAPIYRAMLASAPPAPVGGYTAEDALRSLASWLGVGGYNASEVDPQAFEDKIRAAVDLVTDPWVKDAQRYRKLRGIGAAPGNTLHLRDGNVLVTTNLDAWLDAALAGKPIAPAHAAEYGIASAPPAPSTGEGEKDGTYYPSDLKGVDLLGWIVGYYGHRIPSGLADKLLELMYEWHDQIKAPSPVPGDAGDLAGQGEPVAWAIPPGWVLIPECPPPEMMGAFWRTKNTGTTEIGGAYKDSSDVAAFRAYAAAAPKPEGAR